MNTVQSSIKYKLSGSVLTKTLLALLLCGAGNARADLSTFEGAFSNELEEASAKANQSTYNALLLQGCSDQQFEESADCSGTTFGVFSNVRELVHTANELSGKGPRQFSLGTDIEGLGFALRWTAGEEFAGQASITKDFANGQLSGLASRLTALRFGATGFNLTVDNRDFDTTVASTEQSYSLGGGASADNSTDNIGGFSRWGGFLNGSYGTGDRQATSLEDAFGFDGYQINAGLDYRFNNHYVAGAILAFNDQEIIFDPSQSIVDGGIKSDGFSIMPFVLYQAEQIYWSFSLGYQKMNITTDRAIRYPSINPDINSINTRALGATDSTTISLFSNLGYSFRFNAFAIEPYLSFDYLDISIDSFKERDINDNNFNLSVADQNIKSNEIALGLNILYTFTPDFGVITPSINVQLRNQMEDSSRNISASYSGSNVSENFNLATNKLDNKYYVISISLSSVLWGGSQTTIDGDSSGGLQAFLNYKFVEDLDYFSQEVFTAGIRYEF
ncbi:MAG: autotransporter outer membrane beta-barrel domain-containing protein [Alteromonadaceae bacterium]|nr:autotransporter outer membrane beta-barrel domain-containing protein [Alteromonadaceae bacterium]